MPFHKDCKHKIVNINKLCLFTKTDQFCCGGLTRTDDLWIMSPTSYQLLHSAILLSLFSQTATVCSYQKKSKLSINSFISISINLTSLKTDTIKMIVSTAPIKFIQILFLANSAIDASLHEHINNKYNKALITIFFITNSFLRFFYLIVLFFCDCVVAISLVS